MLASMETLFLILIAVALASAELTLWFYRRSLLPAVYLAPLFGCIMMILSWFAVTALLA